MDHDNGMCRGGGGGGSQTNLHNLSGGEKLLERPLRRVQEGLLAL